MEKLDISLQTAQGEKLHAVLYPVACRNLTRIVEAGGGYFIIGDDMHELGLMDRKGRVIIEPRWNAVRPYIEQNVVMCEKGHVTVLFDLKGETLTGLPLHVLMSESKRGVTVITKGGQTLVCEEIGDFCDGLARVKCAGEWGYVNTRGHYTGTLTGYSAAGDYHDGRALVLKGKGIFKKGKLGYIDREKQEAIPAVYGDAQPFSEGLAAVHTQDGWRYIRPDGSFLECYETVDGQRREIKGFFRAESFANGYAPVFRMGKSTTLPAGDGIMVSMPQDVSGWGLLNKDGELCIPCMFNRLGGVMEDGLCLFEPVTASGEVPRYGILDPKEGILYQGLGEQLLPLGNGYLMYEQGGKKWLIDRRGNPVNHTGLDEVGIRVMTDTFSVKRDGRWGVIAGDGLILMPFEYDMEFNLHNGFAMVKKDGKFFLINEKGEKAFDQTFTDAVNLKKGLALVETDGVRYLADFGYGKQFE